MTLISHSTALCSALSSAPSSAPSSVSAPPALQSRFRILYSLLGSHSALLSSLVGTSPSLLCSSATTGRRGRRRGRRRGWRQGLPFPQRYRPRPVRSAHACMPWLSLAYGIAQSPSLVTVGAASRCSRSQRSPCLALLHLCFPSAAPRRIGAGLLCLEGGWGEREALVEDRRMQLVHELMLEHLRRAHLARC